MNVDKKNNLKAAYISSIFSWKFRKYLSGILQRAKASSPFNYDLIEWFFISRSFMILFDEKSRKNRSRDLRAKKWWKSPLRKCCVESFMFFVARCSPYFPFLLLLDNTGHPAPDQQMQVTKLFNHRSYKKFNYYVSHSQKTLKKIWTKNFIIFLIISFIIYISFLFLTSGTCFRRFQLNFTFLCVSLHNYYKSIYLTNKMPHNLTKQNSLTLLYYFSILSLKISNLNKYTNQNRLVYLHLLIFSIKMLFSAFIRMKISHQIFSDWKLMF